MNYTPPTRTGPEAAAQPAREGAAPAKTVLEVKNLRTALFSRKRVAYAVDGISFSVREGETLGIVGESGSGKTMTARSIMGLPPEPAAKVVGGEVILDGEDLLKLSKHEMQQIRGRKLAIILQDPQTSLNPVYSIGNQIAEVIRPKASEEIPEGNKRARAIDIRSRATNHQLPAPA